MFKKAVPLGGGFVRNKLSNNPKKENPSFGCSFAYAGVQTQCTGSVRIIAPSPNEGEALFASPTNWALPNKLFLNQITQIRQITNSLFSNAYTQEIQSNTFCALHIAQ